MGANIPIVSLSWNQYWTYIQAQNGRILAAAKYSPLPVFPQTTRWSYLDELTACRQGFIKFPSFSAMPLTQRKQVAGTLAPDTDRWFGWMGAAGRFMALVNKQPAVLSAIDAIPTTGPLTAAQVKQYMINTLSIRGVGIATATRLLAMKRPDYCLPITRANYNNLSTSVLGPFCPPSQLKNKSALEINNVAQKYVALLAEIWKTGWWQAPQPATAGWEQTVWEGRVAMLDAIFYDP